MGAFTRSVALTECMSSPLNHPFRPAISLKAEPQQSVATESISSYSSPLDGAIAAGAAEGADKRAKLGNKIKIGLGVFLSLYLLIAIFDPFGGIMDSLTGSFGGRRAARIDDDYELSQFADEEGLADAQRSGDNGVRSVNEANQKAGFFGRMFCKGLGRSQYCD